MVEPISAVISGLVTLMTAYMAYRNEKARIEQQGQPAPKPTKEEQEGDQALQTVKEGVAQHGGATEKQTVVLFEQQPEVFGSPLVQVLTQLAEQQPEFAALLHQTKDELPTLRQQMEAENIRRATQDATHEQNRQKNVDQTMRATGDIEGSEQRG
jgi:hypothetical protein